MARVFIDGFEHGGFDLWTVTGSAPSAVNASSYGMSGNYALSLNGTYLKKVLPVDKSELYVAFKVRPTQAWRTNIWIISFFDTTPTQMLKLATYNQNGALGIFRGSTCLDYTDDNIWKDNTTYLIEVYYKPLNVGGVCTVKLDGIEILSASSVDTTEGLESIHSVQIFSEVTSYYDDIIIDDANWIGQSSIQGITVTGAGTTTSWTPSTSTLQNFETVDEIPYSDTDYNSTNATGSIDTFTTSDLTGSIEKVKCVFLTGRAKFEGSPVPTHVQLGVRSGGANYFATDIDLSTSFTGFSRMLEINPATSASWSESEVNALEIGYKATA